MYAIDVFLKLHVHYGGIIELPDGRAVLHRTHTYTNRASISKGSLVLAATRPLHTVAATKKEAPPIDGGSPTAMTPLFPLLTSLDAFRKAR